MGCLRRPLLARLTCLSVFVAGLLAAGRPAKAGDVEPGPVTIVLDASRPGPVISPLLFGANIEHTRHGTWKGLLAELLANRCFATPGATEQPPQAAATGGEKGQPGVAVHWYGVGNGAVSFALDTAELYSGRQSQRVRVAAAGTSGGIGQRGIAIQAGREYEVRLQLKVEPAGTVAVRLCDAAGRKEYLRKSLRLEPGDWRTCRFRWTAAQTDLEAKFEVLIEGPAALWVGATSLLPADHFHGMRCDVIACFKEISLPILRWPGGTFARDYRWKGGLLPLDKRPLTRCITLPFSDQVDFHEVGTDEYMALCRELGSLPCLTTTMGIPEGAQEAADWVQYCNGSAETAWGKIRADRGHREPYRVRHWCIGNEIWGEWMGPAHTGPEEYARNLKLYAAAMRKVDPSLVLIASGTDAVTLGSDWDKKVAAQAGDSYDWHSLHHYAPITTALAGPAGALEFTRQACRPRDGVLPWLQQIRQAIDQSSPPGKRIPIVFDEWNLWHKWFTRWYETGWHIGPIDAAFAAGQLHMFCREAEGLDLRMAAMFQPVNEGLILVKPFSAELTAMGQAFALLRVHQGGRLLKTDPPRDTRAVDACASLSADGKLVSLTLLNRATDADRTIAVTLTPKKPARAAATILSVKELQPDAVMSKRSENLAIDNEGRANMRLPRFGIALIEFTLDDK